MFSSAVMLIGIVDFLCTLNYMIDLIDLLQCTKCSTLLITGEDQEMSQRFTEYLIPITYIC